MANHNKRKEAHEADREARRGKEFTSSHRWARIAGEKVRLCADQIRGLPINRALEILKFTKKRGGYLLGKVVKTALANAEYQISEQKLDLDIDSLYIADVHVDDGPTMKRWMTRARGMAYPILRRMCHINTTLAPGKKPEGDEGSVETTSGKKGASGSKSKKSKKAATATAGAK